jgi:hypothetical protein
LFEVPLSGVLVGNTQKTPSEISLVFVANILRLRIIGATGPCVEISALITLAGATVDFNLLFCESPLAMHPKFPLMNSGKGSPAIVFANKISAPDEKIEFSSNYNMMPVKFSCSQLGGERIGDRDADQFLRTGIQLFPLDGSGCSVKLLRPAEAGRSGSRWDVRM